MTRSSINHGRDQYNIENIHFNSSPNVHELLNQGLDFFQTRNYQHSIILLKQVIKLNPSLSEPYYYCAFALLSGKKPKKTDQWTISKIEDLLATAITIDSTSSKYYVLLSIVKHGFYTMNGFIEKPPSSDNLFRMGKSIRPNEKKEILIHLNDPTNLFWSMLFESLNYSI